MWIHHATQTPSLAGQPGHKRLSSSAADCLHQLKGGFHWLRYKTDTKICDCQASQEQFWCYVEETFGRAFCWYLNIDINYHWKLQLEWTFLFWVSSCFFFTSNIKNGKIWLKTRYSMPDSACNIEVLTYYIILAVRTCSLLPFNNDISVKMYLWNKWLSGNFQEKGIESDLIN